MKSGRGILFAAVVSLGTAGALTWLFRSPDPHELRPAPAAKTDSTAAPAASGSAKPVVAMTDAAAELPPQIQEEVLRAGQPDPDPLASERRLDRLALELKPEEIQLLSRFVRDFAADGDQRAVGVELLARSPSEAALAALESIALTPVPQLGEPRREGFERALRARALEGLGSHPLDGAGKALQHVASSTDDSFLLDRARRALSARNGQAPEPAKQDNDALRKLLE